MFSLSAFNTDKRNNVRFLTNVQCTSIVQKTYPYNFDHILTESLTIVRQIDVAEVFHNGQWYPICAHYFRANEHGASDFCRQLGYESGTINQESKSLQVQLPSSGISIGKCGEGDVLPYCTGGCNNLKIGMACGGSCEAGAMAGTRIDCFPKGIDY